jgi:TolB-like protein/tetratricopeptide (TPR) repeat protein
MTVPARTIFLSYASQDAAVAARIGEALRAAGLEVWFDQSELRGGDAWDQLIRRRIRECALFMPVISASTQTRLEGYFRLEWRLAVERTHLMADGKTFLVPVVVDTVSERAAAVPEAFRAVQWTQLPAGAVTPAFVERVAHLLAGPGTADSAALASAAAAMAGMPPPTRPPVFLRALPLLAIAVLLGAAVFAGMHFAHRPATPGAAAATSLPGSPAAGTAPEHSVAVLPFTNLSGDPKDEYFSDGLSEELLNTLASVPGLKVAARTSSFSFKGRNEAVGEIARKLNVASVLEGSVRRSGSHIRVSTELIDAATGFQRWSQTYDRDLKDVLAVQSDIATAVAGALKVRLLQTGKGGVEIGGTENPQAFDAFLRAQQLSRLPISPQTHAQTQSAYEAAIALDPAYANAYLGRGVELISYGFNGPLPPEQSHALVTAGAADARRASELAPALGAAHSLIGYALAGQGDLAGAAAQFAKGSALSPGDARTYTGAADFLTTLGRFDEAEGAAHRAIELDPLNAQNYRMLAFTSFWARRYQDGVAAARRALELNDPDQARVQGWLGLNQYGLGDYTAARLSCDARPAEWVNLTCLALANDKLGHRTESDAALAQLVKEFGEGASYQQAQVYAQRGELDKAMATLERALTIGDPGVQATKVDPLLDPLRSDPRFKAFLVRLKIPD